MPNPLGTALTDSTVETNRRGILPNDYWGSALAVNSFARLIVFA